MFSSRNNCDDSLSKFGRFELFKDSDDNYDSIATRNSDSLLSRFISKSLENSFDFILSLRRFNLDDLEESKATKANSIFDFEHAHDIIENIKPTKIPSVTLLYSL